MIVPVAEYLRPLARLSSNQLKITMKRNLLILLGALLFAGAFTPQTSNAGRIVVEIGDQPYYTRGPWYWEGGYRWYWVPGHWVWRHHNRVWIHGHYIH